MSDKASIKPQWLIDFHAYLHARPVRRAVFWALGCFVLFQALHLWWGDAITPPRLLVELLAWSVGGVIFYAIMRWWDANHAR